LKNSDGALNSVDIIDIVGEGVYSLRRGEYEKMLSA